MTTTTAPRTTYTRLKTGDWGLRVCGDAPAPGTTLTVEKKDGSRKQETVERVIWTGNGVALCSIRRVDTRAPRTGGVQCGYSGLWWDGEGLCPHCGDQC